MKWQNEFYDGKISSSNAYKIVSNMFVYGPKKEENFYTYPFDRIKSIILEALFLSSFVSNKNKKKCIAN